MESKKDRAGAASAGVKNEERQIFPEPLVEYYLRKYVRPGDMILDVGCGPAIYRNSTQGTYVGVDFNANSYTEYTGRKQMDVVASAMELPIQNDSFDLVFAKSAFFQFPDPYRALQEFQRVLRKGGKLILFDYNKRTQKILEAKEGYKRPCWTQWQLLHLVIRSGFRRCRLLTENTEEVGIVKKCMRLCIQEATGRWAIVTGVKK